MSEKFRREQLIAKFWECDCEEGAVHLKVSFPHCPDCGLTVEDCKDVEPNMELVEEWLCAREAEGITRVWKLEDQLRQERQLLKMKRRNLELIRGGTQ